MGRPILERDEELAALADAVDEAKAGDGSLVLIAGEAGIGKSSLITSMATVLPPEARQLVGCCDHLATPRVLGPLRDLMGSVGGTLTDALASGDRGRVIDALRAELDWPEHPTVLVVEDVHWADEATLDVLRFLVRRISSLPTVLVLTYRDEEISHDHPLQQLLGLISGIPRVRRLRPARLSAEAVRQLCGHTGMDVDEVYAVTSGNPFFVAEVLSSGDVGAVPHTVAEAVRARLAHLDERTRDAVEQLAVVPSAVERWLVEAVVPGGLASLAAAERGGVLTVSQIRIAFRHELARRAVLDSMPTARRVVCNQAVLAALLERTGVDLSRIVHHAAEAGEVEVIVQHGPAAAREAVAAGSHREAVAHYGLVLEHCENFPPAERADLLEGYAVECYTVGQADLAVRAQEDAVRLRRRLGDRRALGLSLRWLSRMHWWAGARPEAEASGAEAIEVLEGTGDDLGLGFTLSNQSQLHMLAGRRSDSIAVGQRAVAIARDLGDAGLLSHALNNVGSALWDDGHPEGEALLDESLAVALDAHEVEHACRAYVNIVWHLMDDLRLDEAYRVVDAGIALADEAEFLGFLQYLHITRGMIHLLRGEWDRAVHDAEWGVEAQQIMRCPALVVLGLVRIRRGEQGGEELLDQAWQIAQRVGEAQRTGPAASALLEAAWLGGHPARVSPDVYENVRRFGRAAWAAELGYWMRATGTRAPIDESEQPYALLAAGKWREAAEQWRRAGCPYEHAVALTHSPDPADLLSALAALDALGAEPLARRVRQRLRELGVTRIPRGPVRSTRDNPAGLTERQVDVLRLLADGLSNAEIAAQLVLSVRTVDTHVAAILNKLGARTRRAAAAQARAMGLVGER